MQSLSTFSMSDYYRNPISGPTYSLYYVIGPSLNLDASLMLSHKIIYVLQSHSPTPSQLLITSITRTMLLLLPIMHMHWNHHCHVNGHLCSCAWWTVAYWRMQLPRRLFHRWQNSHEHGKERLSADHQAALILMQHQCIVDAKFSDHHDQIHHIIKWLQKKHDHGFDWSNLCYVCSSVCWPVAVLFWCLWTWIEVQCYWPAVHPWLFSWTEELKIPG